MTKAQKGLIALDLDDTIIPNLQDKNEQEFLRPILINLIDFLHTKNVAVMTGNSQLHLRKNFFSHLIESMNQKNVNRNLLWNLDLFCNGGATHLHFRKKNEVFEKTLCFSNNSEDISELLFKFAINSDYIESSSAIPSDHANIIQSILQVAASSPCFSRAGMPNPHIQQRNITYENGISKEVSVQFTLKPIALEDIRLEITRVINQELEQKGLTGYVAKKSGRTSIDIARKGVDKGYAMQFLLEKLNLSGSSVIYFGDEVSITGNDYSILRVPDITVVAVNGDKLSIPEHPQVFFLSTFCGPHATAFLLKLLNHNQMTLDFEDAITALKKECLTPSCPVIP